MKKLASSVCLVMLVCSALAELDAPQIPTSATAPSITGYTLSQSRSAQLGALGKLWDGYKMNVVRGDIGESVAERAFFGGPEVAPSKKGSWVSIAPRYGRQGIDHVFIRVDKNGLPNDIILAESKYGSSNLGYTKDGRQMGPNWRMKRLTAIGDRYYRFANSSQSIIRTKNIPIGAKSMDIYFSKTRKVVIWEDGGKWYTNAEGITDKQLRTRASTYGKYFSSAGTGVIRTRNFEFRILEQSNGDYHVKINTIKDYLDEVQIISTRTVVIPSEFISKGKVDTKVLMEAIKKKHPSWSDKKIKQEAKDIKRVVSNKAFLNAAEAHKQAIKEINHSSLASAGIAGALSFAFQLGAEAWEHGADFESYDFKGISLSTVKGAAVAGAASYAGQRTSLYLADNTFFKRQITSKTAGRIGGCVGASIVLAESFGGCIIGNKNWKDGSIEAGIGAASMVAGHYAAAGVSALIASSAASGATITAGAAGATAAAGTATAASAGTVGTAAAAGAAGAGTAGSGGFMALAAASGPAIAAIAAGAAISYGGYVVYNHYKGIELTKGDFVFNEKKVDLFLTDKERLYHSLDQLLGFTSSNGYADGVGVR